jgi:hypothetical protein
MTTTTQGTPARFFIIDFNVFNEELESKLDVQADKVIDKATECYNKSLAESDKTHKNKVVDKICKCCKKSLTKNSDPESMNKNSKKFCHGSISCSVKSMHTCAKVSDNCARANANKDIQMTRSERQPDGTYRQVYDHGATMVRRQLQIQARAEGKLW